MPSAMFMGLVIHACCIVAGAVRVEIMFRSVLLLLLYIKQVPFQDSTIKYRNNETILATFFFL